MIFSRVRARTHNQRGASAVEFALVLVPLLMLLLGVTTAGLSYNSALASTDAVREGARFGATTALTPAPSPSWPSAVQQRTVDLSYGSLTASQVCVQLYKVGTGALQSTPCSFPSSDTPATPTSVAPGQCVVKVWSQVQVTINALVKVWQPVVKRQSVALYERTCP